MTLSNPRSRREVLRLIAASATGITLSPAAFAMADPFVSKRPIAGDRRFRSKAVDAAIESTAAKIRDPELAWLFSNCLPNTLDTTVTYGSFAGHPDTVVITGDIAAMWLRDSSAQVWPYLPFISSDEALAALIQGVIRRQTRCILTDPYANAFMPDLNSSEPLSWSKSDETQMKHGVGERKWEVDSLCYPVRLAHRYWKESRDTKPFDEDWARAMHLIVTTFRQQQRKLSSGPYSFRRSSASPTESLNGDGFGNPARPVGLIYSGFRPSDDACTYPLNIPGNFFAVETLLRVEEMFSQIARDDSAARDAGQLAAEIRAALKQYAPGRHPEAGNIWAYEVDGFGNALFMDDANVPSLLSLPYLGCCSATDPLYLATRRFVLSAANPYFYKGSAVEGIGGPHEGQDMIWPMSITMRALTTEDEQQQLQCLRWLKKSNDGTGFMHESFHKNDPAKFTRAWFAWANTLFGELILSISKKSPKLLALSDL
jgi:meiotically up-regulated gene 157 (Mug157) protein